MWRSSISACTHSACKAGVVDLIRNAQRSNGMARSLRCLQLVPTSSSVHLDTLWYAHALADDPLCHARHASIGPTRPSNVSYFLVVVSGKPSYRLVGVLSFCRL